MRIRDLVYLCVLALVAVEFCIFFDFRLCFRFIRYFSVIHFKLLFAFKHDVLCGINYTFKLQEFYSTFFILIKLNICSLRN